MKALFKRIKASVVKEVMTKKLWLALMIIVCLASAFAIPEYLITLKVNNNLVWLAALLTPSIVIFAIVVLFDKRAKYNAKENIPTYDKEQAEITRLLKTYGSMPVSGLVYLAKPRTLSFGGILNAVAASRTLEITQMNDAKVVSLNTPTDTSTLPPVPQNGSYVLGYYQMYNRLQRLRENPELADVPLEMIDTLYDTAIKRP